MSTAAKDTDLVLKDTSGGRNPVDSPLMLHDNQCYEALNMDWEEGLLATRRRGAVSITTGAIAWAAGLQPAAMFRHVPGGDESAAEFWILTTSGAFWQWTVGGGWAAVTATDACTGNYYEANFCTFNGKLFIAYKSAQDRLHVYDPVNAKIRRVGLAAPAAAATVANTGGGAYAATPRLYRVRFLDYVGGVIRRRSEPSATVSFTPSGAGTAARITRPAVVDGDETHWEVETALTANGPWWVLAGVATTVVAAPIAIATTTYDDSTATTAYNQQTSSEDAGWYQLPQSAKYLVTDNNRLVWAGSYTNAWPRSRVWWTPVLGSADHGDDERYLNTNLIKGWTNCNEKDGGDLTGLAPPIEGVIYAFKLRQTWRLTPTGEAIGVYSARRVSGTVGLLNQKSLVVAEDANGNPMIAFLSVNGPYRIASGGLQKTGRDVDDLWFGFLANYGSLNSVNLDASTVISHAVYHADRHQIWFWVANSQNNSPSLKLMLDVRRNAVVDRFGLRGGWAVHTGESANAACSCMFSNVPQPSGPGANIHLFPYIGHLIPFGATDLNPVWRCDEPAFTDDAGTKFQAYVVSRPLDLSGQGDTLGGFRESYLVAKKGTATIRQLVTRDFGTGSSFADVVLSGTGNRVYKKIEGGQDFDIGYAYFQLGDADANQSVYWSLDHLYLQLTEGGEA